MRIGIFGGTFDPVHQGHLILAEQAREQGRLDEVWFIPAPRPPQKEAGAITRFEQRVEMLTLALAGQPAFRVDRIEEHREGPSYTADTLTELRHRHPEHEFWLLIGGDSLADLPTWREPARIVRQAGLLVTERAGVPLPSAEDLRARLGLAEDEPLRLQVIDTLRIEIASRDLRKRVASGRSIRYFLPRSVEVYIHEKGLYLPLARDEG
jgi:nicotinate-nucleotide adenylyltransferase